MASCFWVREEGLFQDQYPRTWGMAVRGMAGVELHLIFGQWVWSRFAGSSVLHIEYRLMSWGHSLRLSFTICLHIFHNQTPTHDWMQELQKVQHLGTQHGQGAHWLQFCLCHSHIIATKPSRHNSKNVKQVHTALAPLAGNIKPWNKMFCIAKIKAYVSRAKVSLPGLEHWWGFMHD